MSRIQRMVAVGVFSVVGQLSFSAGVQAGPVLDWLLGRPILTYPSPTVAAYPGYPAVAPAPGAVPMVGAQPVVAAYPSATTTLYPSATPNTYPSATTTIAGYPGAAVAPATAMAPAPVMYAPATAQSTMALQPTTVAQPVIAAQPIVAARPVVVAYPPYRTSWLRVPLTYYRPVTSYAGVPAQPVTVMQPCNTYTWQAQRVPLLFRAHRPWLPATAAAPIATACPMQAAYPVTVAQPAVANPCPCPLTAGMSASPAYATPAPFVAPTTSMPAYPQPGTSMPATGTEPADQAPALPLDSIPGAIPNSAAASSGAPALLSEQPATPTTTSSVYQVKPIPVPDVNGTAPSRAVTAPPLLTPRDRTASQTSARTLSVTPAVWTTPPAASTAAVKPQAAPAATAPAAAPQGLWNDRGWKSTKSW